MKHARKSTTAPNRLIAAVFFGVLITSLALPYLATAQVSERIREQETLGAQAPGAQPAPSEGINRLPPEYQSQAREVETTQTIQQTTSALPNAITPQKCGWTQFTCAILLALNFIVDFLIHLVFPIGQAFLEQMLSYSFDFVKEGNQFQIATVTGWKIVLGIVNMFFVLLLLWIAIATIFDLEMFSARKTIGSFIIAALLINFSLPIGRAVINLSNGIAGVFLSQINQGLGGVTSGIQQMFDPTALTLAIQNQYVSMDPEQALELLRNSSVKVQEGVLGYPLLSKRYTALQCEAIVKGSFSWIGYYLGSQTYRACYSLLSDVKVARALVAVHGPEESKNTLLAGALVAKVLVAPVALFVIFGASIMLLMRIIMLILLLIGGPLAFFSLAMPGLAGTTGEWGWSAWWSNLFKWSFYLPAFLFLFMLSLVVLQGIPKETLDLILAGKAVPDLTALMINYLIGLGLMIASLMVGLRMGIWGAKGVTGYGSKLAGGVGKWAKGTGKIVGGGAAGAVLGTALGQRLAGSRATRWMLRPVEAARAVGQKVQDDREKAALKRRTMASKASPAYSWSLMQGMSESEQADLTRELKPHQLKGILGAAPPAGRMKFYKTMQPFDLEDKALDAAPDLTAVVEMATQTERTDPRFQEAFTSWFQSVPKSELQKRITAPDIQTNGLLQRALLSRSAAFRDITDIANTREKALALGEWFVDLSNVRAQVEQRIQAGMTRAEALRETNAVGAAAEFFENPRVKEELQSSPIILKIEHGIALGKRIPRREEEPIPEEAPPPTPSTP